MASLTQAGITFGDGTSQTTAAIPSGTVMLFQQTAAPTGWTKQTTHNDKALRVVSGTAGSGGSVGFSAFTAQTIGATTLSESQMPAHLHGFGENIMTEYGNMRYTGSGGSISGGRTATNNAGGSGSHTHSLNMALQYVDLIIASKN